MGEVLERMDQLEGRQGLLEVTVNELYGGIGKLQSAIKVISAAGAATVAPPTAPTTTTGRNAGVGDRSLVTQGDLRRVSAAVLETAETLTAMMAGLQRDFVYVVARERDAFRSVREQLESLGAGNPVPQEQLEFIDHPDAHGPQNQQQQQQQGVGPQRTLTAASDDAALHHQQQQQQLLDAHEYDRL